MIQEILCVARNPIQASELVKRIESMGIPVEFRNQAEQKAVKSAMRDSGASDVYESVELAA